MNLGFFGGTKKQANNQELEQLSATKVENEKLLQMLKALSTTFAVIEFHGDGTIITANENFLATVGYTLAEIEGQHHRLFVTSQHGISDDYRSFWQKLSRGESFTGEFHRIGKGNRNIWLRASYIPVLDAAGKVIKVIKYAFDVTHEKLLHAELESQLTSIRQTQAVIEFTPEGTILNANQNFLNALGYSLQEITGKHHSLFVDDQYGRSQEYKNFWQGLRMGKFFEGEFCRVTKKGGKIWINASYNPITDPVGNVVKVVKFAVDITADVLTRQEAATVSSTLASSVSQMASTITEISRSINVTSAQAHETKNLVVETDKVITSLSESSRKIGEVTDLIGELAEQTNLLALNATIEAARAGDSGKGFAVVASEVKSLAIETRSATQTIGTNINEIRNRIKEIVESSHKINDKVTDVSSNMLNVSSAVEEQSVTMSSLQETATKLAAISRAA